MEWNRERRAGSAYADADRNVWLAVPRLAGRAVPRGRASAAVARALRHPLPDRGEQQQLLPAAVAGDVRRLAGADPGRLRHGGQGQPVSDPRTPAARPGRAGGPADRRGGGAGNQARAGPAPAAADAEGRPGHAGRVPEGVPDGSRCTGRARAPGRGGASARDLVDRRDTPDPGRTQRNAVLGRPARPPDHAFVAYRDVGLPAVPRGHGAAVAQLRVAGAEVLGGTIDRDLAG